MFERILVPLDGSALAEQALPTAARLARATGGAVILLRVVSPPIEYANGSTFMNYTPTNVLAKLIEADLVDARHYLEAVAASSVLQCVHTQLEVQMGVAASLIFSTADSQQCDIIVMSSHGQCCPASGAQFLNTGADRTRAESNNYNRYGATSIR